MAVRGHKKTPLRWRRRAQEGAQGLIYSTDTVGREDVFPRVSGVYYESTLGGYVVSSEYAFLVRDRGSATGDAHAYPLPLSRMAFFTGAPCAGNDCGIRDLHTVASKQAVGQLR